MDSLPENNVFPSIHIQPTTSQAGFAATMADTMDIDMDIDLTADPEILRLEAEALEIVRLAMT